MIDKDLMKILACPVCKGSLKQSKNKLTCKKCGKVYEVRDGIPILLP